MRKGALQVNCGGPTVNKSGYDEDIPWVSTKFLNYDVFNYVSSPMSSVEYYGTILINFYDFYKLEDIKLTYIYIKNRKTCKYK